MRGASILKLVLLGVGVTLFIWSVAPADSLSSEASVLTHSAPSNQAIALMVVSILVVSFGLMRLLRRPAS